MCMNVYHLKIHLQTQKRVMMRLMTMCSSLVTEFTLIILYTMWRRTCIESNCCKIYSEHYVSWLNISHMLTAAVTHYVVIMTWPTSIFFIFSISCVQAEHTHITFWHIILFVEPFPTVVTCNDGLLVVIWHPAFAKYFLDNKIAYSSSQSYSSLFDNGKRSKLFLTKDFTKCSLILLVSHWQSTGSIPRTMLVAHATAKIPQT